MGGFSGGTTMADSQQNIRASTTAWVGKLNSDAQGIYDQAVRNYNLNMRSGQRHDPPLVAPTAPLAYVVSDPDANGYVWPVVGTVRLTPTPPLTVATVDLGTLSKPFFPPFLPQIGNATPGGGGKWFDALPGDTFPNGQTTEQTISADGTTGRFEKFGAPVGYGWYLLVS